MPVIRALCYLKQPPCAFMIDPEALGLFDLAGIKFMRRSDSQPRTMSRTGLALDNLRAVTIVIVLAFHSALAYLQWIPVGGAGFDQPPYAWRAFPIVDDHRFFGFDLFCASQDVDLMVLMFLLSGLFVWPSLLRKKDPGFLRVLSCGCSLRSFRYRCWLLVKAPVVFGGTLFLSLATTLAARRFPWGARLIGTAPRAIATS